MPFRLVSQFNRKMRPPEWRVIILNKRRRHETQRLLLFGRSSFSFVLLESFDVEIGFFAPRVALAAVPSGRFFSPLLLLLLLMCLSSQCVTHTSGRDLVRFVRAKRMKNCGEGHAAVVNYPRLRQRATSTTTDFDRVFSCFYLVGWRSMAP